MSSEIKKTNVERIEILRENIINALLRTSQLANTNWDWFVDGRAER